MIRRLFIFLLCILLLVPACSCSKTGTGSSSGKLSVVTTNFALYDFARSVAGDMADVKMLMDPGVESHSYDPSPADIVSIYSCDVFIYTGGESDSWLTNILESISENDTHILAMMDCVDLLEEEETDSHEHEHAHADEEEDTEYDEHIWTSPVNAIVMTEAIADAFIQCDNANAQAYQDNCDSYTKQLLQLDSEIQSIVDNASRRTLVFGDRMPVLYFLRRYGLECYAAFPGCASETEPSATTLAMLIDRVRQDSIPVVFTIELSNGQIADIICEETGAAKRQFNTCHNISRDDFQDGATYLSLMYENTEVLKEALN